MSPSTAPARRLLLALLVLSGCAGDADIPLQPRGDDPPALGQLVVSNATAGSAFDVDGYELIVTDASSQPYRLALPVNDVVILPQVRAGAVTVELADLAQNCSVSEGSHRTVIVPKSGTARVNFSALCAPAYDPLATLPAHVLFLRQAEPGSAHIVVLDPRTGAERQLTPKPDAYGALAMSPDGRRLAFDRGGELYVMDVDGSGLTPLGVAGRSPAWAPDGQRIAFSDAETGGTSIVGASGAGLVRLSVHAPSKYLYDVDPTWSPDGGLIAFTRYAYADSAVIWTIRPDGSGAARLGRGLGAVWSPDGSRLAFLGASAESTGLSIFVADRDGGNVTEIRRVENAWVERVGAWSSDGNWITFAMHPIGRADGIRRDLWLHRIADGHEIRLTADGRSRAPTLIPPLR